MRKEKSKRQSETAREMRRLGVMIEQVGGDVRKVAEQYGDIKKTLNGHTEMIASMKTDLEVVKEDVGIMKGDIEFIKNSLKKKVDVEEFAALERRVALLEKKASR